MASKLIKRIWGTPFAEQEREEAEFVKQIERGLANGEFKMYLQFLVDNKEKKIVSAEVSAAKMAPTAVKAGVATM